MPKRAALFGPEPLTSDAMALRFVVGKGLEWDPTIMTKRDYEEHLRVFRAIAADIRRGGMTTQSLSIYEQDPIRGGDIDHVSTLLRNGLIETRDPLFSGGREIRPVTVHLTRRGELYLKQRGGP